MLPTPSFKIVESTNPKQVYVPRCSTCGDYGVIETPARSHSIETLRVAVAEASAMVCFCAAGDFWREVLPDFEKNWKARSDKP